MSKPERLVYRVYSDYLQERFGGKVYKLPLALAHTCPNRDGTLGFGGCTFCGEEGGSFGGLDEDTPLGEQIEQVQPIFERHYGKTKYLAYFQRFTNTYVPLEKLKAYMEEIKARDFVGVIISTRPDCLPDSHLDYLAELNQQIEVTLELGLQTIYDDSLEKLNRGHSVADFIDATKRAHAKGLRVCTHLILNLPWDGREVAIEAAKLMNALRVEEVKLHALYIMENTKLGDQYQRGEFQMHSLAEYEIRVIEFLRHLDPDIIVQRVIGRAPEEGSLFVNWSTSWWKIRDEIVTTMLERGYKQGDALDHGAGE